MAGSALLGAGKIVSLRVGESFCGAKFFLSWRFNCGAMRTEAENVLFKQGWTASARSTPTQTRLCCGLYLLPPETADEVLLC